VDNAIKAVILSFNSVRACEKVAQKIFFSMIEYLNGNLAELTPTLAVVDVNGVGYAVNITLVTYSELTGKTACKLYIYEAIREDAHLLYGFSTQSERELFLLLISVSGVGANTARMIMSSLSAAELQEAIVNENVSALKNVKGIGLKTAQRIVVDLHDKMGKVALAQGDGAVAPVADSGVKSEAVAALVMLGFQQSASQKAVDKLLKDEPQLPVAQLIKKALRIL
jgi:holliday junction DNA helicase RuvA